jgi:hypothetical protein
MRNLNMNNKYSYQLGKQYSYIERSCHNKKNHYVQLFTNKETKRVDYIKFSLDPKYSKTIEINYYKRKCILHLITDNKTHTIDIPKIIEPDFPSLIKLKQQVSLYSLFS